MDVIPEEPSDDETGTSWFTTRWGRFAGRGISRSARRLDHPVAEPSSGAPNAMTPAPASTSNTAAAPHPADLMCHQFFAMLKLSRRAARRRGPGTGHWSHRSG